MIMDSSMYEGKDVSNTATPKFNSEKPTLHEILIAEKLDFEVKVQRATRRKKWLKGTFVQKYAIFICSHLRSKMKSWIIFFILL